MPNYQRNQHIMQPKITIITVCYNGEKAIEKTLKSVINQSYSNVEYIVIDGKSTDQTLDIIRKYSDKIAKIVSEPDKGIFDAMNKGLQLATGTWVNFMNVGDRFYADTTLEQLFQDEIAPETGIVYGDTESQKGLLKMTPFYQRRKKNVPMGICHQSLFVRTEPAKRIGFDEKFKVTADYNMVFQLYKQGYGFHYVPVPVAVYDLRGFSARNNVLQFKEVATIRGVKKTPGYYVDYALVVVKSIIKNILY